MNKQDRDFYIYLNSLPNVVFDQWLLKASPEDIERADRIFDEVKFGNLDEVDDLTEAQEVLKKFTLKG